MVDNSQFYGIGKGDAQVIDNSGINNAFAGILAKQQAQRQQEQKALAEQAAKISPNGLRNDADRVDFFNKVDGWKQQAIQSQNERDPFKKAMLKAKADQAYLEAQDLVNKSKQQGARDSEFQKFAMNDATRHQLTDDAISKGLGNTKLGVNDPNLVDYQSLQRAPNIPAFEKRLNDINTQRLNNTKEDYQLGKTMGVGNTQQTPISKFKKADANAQALDYLNEATINHDFANVLQSKYPQFYQGAQTTDDYHKAHALAATQLVKDTPLYKDMGTTFSRDNQPDMHNAHRLFDQAHPLTPGSSTTPGVPRDVIYPYAGGNGVVNMKGAVNLTSAKMNLGGSSAINMDTGIKDPQVLSSGDYQIVNISNVDFTTKDLKDNKGNVIPAGSIAQPDFAKSHPGAVKSRPVLQVQQTTPGGHTSNHLIDANRLPANVPKSIKQAIANFKPEGAQEAQPKNEKVIVIKGSNKRLW